MTKTKTTSTTAGGIGLSLELGQGWGGHHRHGSSGGGSSRWCGFTFLQMRELEHQSLIYSYIKAGLPVPFHLILPVWKSVACSFTGLTAARLHQSNLVGYSSLFDEYKNSMEAEPGRCRRTDGKKWRCRKEVVPNHKYCQRHMHRGRHRSRKHVEEPPGQLTTATTGGGDVVSTPINNNNALLVAEAAAIFSPDWVSS